MKNKLRLIFNRFKWYMQPIYWAMVYIPLCLICLAAYVAYLRVSGDVTICKIYYSEMNTIECFFSSKTVRIPK